MVYTTPRQRIISEIQNYITYPYYNWYVGIASDARKRLFTDHAVDEHSDLWIFRLCDTSHQAREIEQYFLSLGVDGGSGGGSSLTRYVYAYKKSYSTRP